jgi:hypothetical protein
LGVLIRWLRPEKLPSVTYPGCANKRGFLQFVRAAPVYNIFIFGAYFLIMEKFTKVKELVAAVEADVEKFYNSGNAAAGTRVRKAMQDLKVLAQEIRLEVQDQKTK